MLKHIWIIFTDKESLWCKWIYSTFYKKEKLLGGQETNPLLMGLEENFTTQLRREFQLSFVWRIGDGRSMSFWFDHQHPRGPLNLLFLDSLIYSSGLSRQATVADLFSPSGQSIRIVLESWEYPLPILSQVPNQFNWMESSSGLFSVASAREAIRSKKNRVPWAALIWCNTISLRFQFNLWLITKNRLATQVPFVVIDGSQWLVVDYVVVNMDGSRHHLPLTTLCHQLQLINSSLLTHSSVYFLVVNTL